MTPPAPKAILGAGKTDLIAVGRPLLANPDLVERWKAGAPLNAPDMKTSIRRAPGLHRLSGAGAATGAGLIRQDLTR